VCVCVCVVLTCLPHSTPLRYRAHVQQQQQQQQRGAYADAPPAGPPGGYARGKRGAAEMLGGGEGEVGMDYPASAQEIGGAWPPPHAGLGGAQSGGYYGDEAYDIYGSYEQGPHAQRKQYKTDTGQWQQRGQRGQAQGQEGQSGVHRGQGSDAWRRAPQEGWQQVSGAGPTNWPAAPPHTTPPPHPPWHGQAYAGPDAAYPPAPPPPPPSRTSWGEGGGVMGPPHAGGGGNGQWKPPALRTGGGTEWVGYAAGMTAGSGTDSEGVHASRAHLIVGQQFHGRPHEVGSLPAAQGSLPAAQDPRRGVYDRPQPQPQPQTQPPHQKRTPPHMQQQQQPMRKPNAAPHQAHLFIIIF